MRSKLIIVLLLFCFCFEETNPRGEDEITTYKIPNLEYTLHYYDEDEGYPYIKWPGNKKREEYVNKKIDLRPSSENDGEWGEYGSFIYASNSILTVEYFLWEDIRGAAHPNEGRFGINIDLDYLEVLRFDDVFTDLCREKLAKILRKKIIAKLLKDPTREPITKEDREVCEKMVTLELAFSKEFCITKRGVRFYYSPCDFSCAVGGISVDVSFSQLSSLVKKDGPLSVLFY